MNKTSGGSTISSYGSFTYDGVFNLTGYAASVTGQSSQTGSAAYEYDNLDRLLDEDSSIAGHNTFAYDSASNPTTFRGTGSLTYNSNNQKTNTGFSYDGNGNPTTYGGTTFGYDLESRLTSIGSSWSAGYRPDGLRGSKTSGSTTTYFLYDGGRPVLEIDGSGNVKAINVFGADGLVGRLVPGSGGSNTQYLFDHQGNVAQRLDGNGSVISKSTYDAYGAESSTSTPSDPFGYNAQSAYYLDRETGLYICTSRYYDPSIGRWINRDPIGYAGGINLYGYCGGNPVSAVDSSGLQGDNIHKGAAMADALSDGSGTAIESLAGGESWDVAPGIIDAINGTGASTLPAWIGPAARAAALLGAASLPSVVGSPQPTFAPCDDVASTNDNLLWRAIQDSGNDYPLSRYRRKVEQDIGLRLLKDDCEKNFNKALRYIKWLQSMGYLGSNMVGITNARILRDYAYDQYSKCLSGSI